MSTSENPVIDFNFPFEPYDIQLDFMKNLYNAIEENKFGIFESPTGTGKSLSLICGSLKWLTDYEEKQKDEAEKILKGQQPSSTKPEISEEPSWVDEFFEQKAAKDLYTKVKEKEDRKKNILSNLEALRRKSKKRKIDSIDPVFEDTNNNESGSNDINTDDADIVLTEYQSDTETDTHENEDDAFFNDTDVDDIFKIFYCSRTHSQLSQFIHELAKSKFSQSIKMVPLASRQSLCINEDVKKLKSTTKINEACLDMQRQKKADNSNKENSEGDINLKKCRKKTKTSGCQFYAYKKFHEMKDFILVDIQDIEQLVSLGNDLSTCPYYASRHSIAQAQLVVLPYQMLLHKSTRESLGIKLKGNVVIIDEAHNLIETINNIHSIEVKVAQIVSSINELSQYKEKYKNRLKAKNLYYIEQLIYILNSINEQIKPKNTPQVNETANTELLTINDFMCRTKLENINLFKIKKYCQKSEISKKVPSPKENKVEGYIFKELNGFTDRYKVAINSPEESTISTQFLYMESLFEALTNVDKDGRILITREEKHFESRLKFLHLNPAIHFEEIVTECRSVIVAGGTMQPVSEFKNIILNTAKITEDQIAEFSCGHVIPQENLKVLCLEKGPSSLDLEFNFQNRKDDKLISELGRLIHNISTVTPGGIVCFFSSYEYEQYVYSKWWNSGLLQKIESKKKVFREPKKSSVCEKILSEYTNHIKRSRSANVKQNGAILLSVVGGKMSEGINFSDDLGRCVVMVGLPYPNIMSAELKEKMQFLDNTLGPPAGQEHYENICMKAVNQSIGRAIRHKNDYATILLVDKRYSKLHVQRKLPSWMTSRLEVYPRFGPAISCISKFFADKRTATH